MSKRKKAGCGSMLLGCAGFCVVGFAGLAFFSILFTGSLEHSPQREKQVEKEYPLGTEDRMKHEVSQAVASGESFSISQQKGDLSIILTANEAPLFGLSESRFQIEFTSILKAIHNSGYDDYGYVSIAYYAPLVDKFGNEEQHQVASLGFEKSNLDKVNWDNFLHINLKSIATDYAFHPAVERRQ